MYRDSEEDKIMRWLFAIYFRYEHALARVCVFRGDLGSGRVWQRRPNNNIDILTADGKHTYAAHIWSYHTIAISGFINPLSSFR